MRERVNEKTYNKNNELMKIIEYNNSMDIIVEFQDKYKAKIHTTYQNFKKGVAKNPYHKEIYNVGYIGQGKYDFKNYPKIYYAWKSMLQRCYDPYFLNKEPTYIDCYVCNEWHCFQNFAEWYEKEEYNCNGERLQLDKDILIKGNKIYSPQTCILVPHRINSLFTKRQNHRGDYPIGVSYRSRENCLYVQCSILDINNEVKRKHLGQFPLNKPFQAFTCYKNYKENIIKKVADEYKNLIPKELYNALYKYKIEIND